MIVGREEIVGGASDYDELMEHAGFYGGPEYPEYTGAAPAAPAPPPAPHPQGPPPWPGQAPGAPYGSHPGHAMMPMHPYAHAFAPPHGFAPHPGAHPQYTRARPQAYARADGGPRVVQRKHTDLREFPVGFIATAVAAGQPASVEVKPQVLFRGERLAVANSIAPFFIINDIKVGKDSQLAASGNLPAEAFSNLSVGVRMELDTAEPGIVITLTITNTDTTGPHDFRAVLYGTVLD